MFSGLVLVFFFYRANGQVIDFGGGLPACERIQQIEQLIWSDIIDKDMIPDALRFGFHSCIGGCNGCIKIDQPDNKGLQSVHDALEVLYKDNNLSDEGISRGDLWTMTSIIAVEAGVRNHEGVSLERPCFKYYWGRQDCPTAPYEDVVLEFPQPSMSSLKMFEYFKKTFGFEPKEVAAIMGAHTLGKAVVEDNGFNGIWTPLEDTAFNVTYYENMLTRNLKYHNVDATAEIADTKEPHWQWEAKQPNGEVSMMFNTDFDVFFDIEVDAHGKATCVLEPTCEHEKTCGKNNVCRKSATHDQAKEYTTNPQKFYKDFKKSFSKMLKTGFPNLVSRGSNCGPCSEA